MTRSTERLRANGLLFFNDPHASGTAPGRRIDRYADAIIGKLTWLFAYANEHHLVPVCTGDLFDAPVVDEHIKTAIIRLLRSCWTNRIIILPGNHDIEGAKLSDADSLGVLAATGLANIPVNGGAFDLFDIENEAGQIVRVGVGGTPYGQDIPDDVSDLFDGEADGVIWLTHANLAFGGDYPGAMPLAEIKGCSLAINGHMHDSKPPVECGDTLWLNFGSIARTDVSALHHRPQAMVFRPDRMTYLPVPHEASVFNLTGRLVETVKLTGGAARQEAEEKESAFVALFRAVQLNGDGRTSDGVLLADEIRSRREDGSLSADAASYLLTLMTELDQKRPIQTAA